MESIIITATINQYKRAEYFQTMEMLKTLVKSHCHSLDVITDKNNGLTITITFNNKNDMEGFEHNNEFNILKGALKSLCYCTSIKMSSDTLDKL